MSNIVRVVRPDEEDISICGTRVEFYSNIEYEYFISHRIQLH